MNLHLGEQNVIVGWLTPQYTFIFKQKSWLGGAGEIHKAALYWASALMNYTHAFFETQLFFPEFCSSGTQLQILLQKVTGI